MRTLLSNLIHPLPLFWILIILSYWFYRKKNRKVAITFLSCIFLLLLIVSTPFVPNQLVKSLENRYSTCNMVELKGKSNIQILVLGAGHTNDERLPANNQLGRNALVRLTEGIRICNELDGSTLVTSGWSGKREDIPQAVVMARAAMILGVDSSRIKKQTLPKNTWMEATEYKRLFGDTTNLVLVTSAVHMPRAMFLFKKAGLNPVPAPTDHLIKKGKTLNPWFWIPKSANIAKTEAAIHEYAGLWWYKLGGENFEQ